MRYPLVLQQTHVLEDRFESHLQQSSSNRLTVKRSAGLRVPTHRKHATSSRQISLIQFIDNVISLDNKIVRMIFCLSTWSGQIPNQSTLSSPSPSPGKYIPADNLRSQLIYPILARLSRLCVPCQRTTVRSDKKKKITNWYLFRITEIHSLC